MEGNGWIKIHRKLLLKGYYTQSQYVHLWIHLLLIANHKPNEYMTNGKIILIKEGQLLTGRKKLSVGTGIPESTVEDILKLLENEHQIQQQKTTKYRLITILNWKDYQTSDNQPTTGQQPADTNKNDKKEKNLGVALAPPGFTLEEENPKDLKNSGEMLLFYEIFSHNPARLVFKTRTHEREATKVLLKQYGHAECLKRYKVSQKYKDEAMCPQFDSPSDMLTKMVKMETFLKNL